MFRCVKKSCLFILLVSSQVQAYELPAVEQDKLIAAQRLAARVYQETKDAAGAVKVMEEAGVQRLDKGQPSNMTRKSYLDILEAYGGYLARHAGADETAASYLKTVIKADSRRASALRSLGELYHRRYNAKPDPQYRRIYQGAFKKYVGLLLEQRGKIVLPSYISEAVYPQAKDICSLVYGLNRQNRLADLTVLFNPERQVSELDLSNPEGIHTLLGASFEDFKQSSTGAITRSKIDIDNDDSIELRFTARTAIGCQRNLFYKKYGDQIALLSNNLLDQFYSADRICSGDALQMVRFGNVNYLLEVQAKSLQEPDLVIFELRPSGEYLQHCQTLRPSVLQQNLVQECQAPVCNQLARNIDSIVKEDGQVGSEWLVSDVSAQQFTQVALRDPVLKPFTESPHQYLVDLDNDGERELITRLWNTLPDGSMEYQYRLFKSRGGQWQAWTLPSADEGLTPGPWQWFFVQFFENLNYIVSYSASKDVNVASTPVMRYHLVVYILKNDRLSRLGEIRTHQTIDTANTAGR